MNQEFNYTTVDILETVGVQFDAALPQGFYDQLYNLTGHNPLGHVVYAYPPEYSFGWPVAITEAGAVMLGAIDHANGTNYSDGIEVGGLC